jgi:hypothetical protein
MLFESLVIFLIKCGIIIILLPIILLPVVGLLALLGSLLGYNDKPCHFCKGTGKREY